MENQVESESSAAGDLKVVLQEPILVHSKEATPEQKLYLTVLDRQAPLFIYSLYFYNKDESKGTKNVFAELKDAMERNLVAYYPAAGRIKYNESGEPELHCANQGVVLVEAWTDAKIADFGDMRNANHEFEKFVYRISPGPDTALIVAQVTRCGCGGFVIGFGSRHELFDGLSALQFLSDWASLARGVSLEEIQPPCHDRELLRPKVLSNGIETDELGIVVKLNKLFAERFQGIPMVRRSSIHIENLETGPKHVVKALSISHEMIKSLKEKALEGGHISTCTTFDVLAAHAWLARIKALQLKPSERALLEFTVNSRPKVVPPLPPKYIGNAFVIAYANCSVQEVLTAPFHSAVRVIQETKASVTDAYIWESIDLLKNLRAEAKTLPSFRETTIVSDWTKFSFHQLDFGWGAAAFATPVAMLLPDALFLLRDGLDKGDICLKLGLLPEAMDAFERYFYEL